MRSNWTICIKTLVQNYFIPGFMLPEKKSHTTWVLTATCSEVYRSCTEQFGGLIACPDLLWKLQSFLSKESCIKLTLLKCTHHMEVILESLESSSEELHFWESYYLQKPAIPFFRIWEIQLHLPSAFQWWSWLPLLLQDRRSEIYCILWSYRI